MLGKIILNIFLLLALVALQLGLVTSLPYFMSGTNLVLISIVFILGVYGFWTALYWTIGVAVLLDIYSFVFFGDYLLSFLLILLMANFLFGFLFTNKSLYSFLMLVSFGYIFFEVFFIFFHYLEVFLQKGNFDIVFDGNFFTIKVIGLLSSLVVSVIVFNSLNFLTNKLKPVFLFRS